jgi:hypothetical protein
MLQLQILDTVDRAKTKSWLSCIYWPLIVQPDFFITMGFPRGFVLQYLRRHSNVLRQDGQNLQAVRGISELDFLQGLAEAIGADTSKANRKLAAAEKTRRLALNCLARLNEIDREGRSDEVNSSAPCRHTDATCEVSRIEK